jgi:SAM-dependent methyltransferase
MGSVMDTYTHGHSEVVLRSHRWRSAQNSAAYLLGELRTGDRILDVGCGPGTITADLAALVAPGPVLGVDLSDVAITEARVHSEGVDNLSFVVGDVRDLPAPSGGYDVIHAHQVLQHLSDPVGALAAMRALLAPGGLVAARDADYPGFRWWPEDPRLDRWLEIYEAVTQRNRAHCDAGRRLLSWALAAGFTDVRYSTSTWTFADPEDRAWWGLSWAERVVSSQVADQAISYGIADRAALVECADGWRNWVEQPDGVFVLVHGELLARDVTA